MSNELATTNAADYICTVDRSNREGVIKVANALSDAESLKDWGDEHFILTDVVTTPGTRARTGEECVNVYLLTADGHIFMTQSEGIRRSVLQIVNLFEGDFGDGIEVSVVSRELASGNTIKSLHFYA